MNGEAHSTQVIVFVVHGTFAPNASWTDHEQSSLYRTLNRNLASQGLVLKWLPIRWSGANSLAARRKAAAALLEAYKREKQSDPNATFAAVGHSHGGSVIAYALADSQEFCEDLKSAFLSTPFVDMRVRPAFANVISVPLTFVGYASILAFILSRGWNDLDAFVFTKLGLDHLLPSASADIIHVLVIAAIVFPPMVGLLVAVHAYLCRFLRRRCETYETTFSTANLKADGHLFIRCVGDEATAALSAGQFANWAMARLFDRSFAFMNLFDLWAIARRLYSVVKPTNSERFSWSQLARVMSSLLVASIIITVLLKFGGELLQQPTAKYFGDDLSRVYGTGQFVFGLVSDLARDVDLYRGVHDLPGILGSFVLIVVYCFMVGAMSAGLICIILFGFGLVFLMVATLLLGLVFRVFGGAAFLRNLVLDISVEPVPLGNVTVIQLNWDGVGIGRLNHSHSYENSQVHAVIFDWILARAFEVRTKVS